MKDTNVYRWSSIVVVAGLLLLGCVPALAATSEHDLFAYGYDVHRDFVAFDPNYPREHDKLSKALDAAQAEMIRQQRAGRMTFCTRQVFLEAKWLVYQTADYPRARRRIEDLRRTLAGPVDPHGPEQAEADGSFAPCCDAWWLRMDMTCDELITLARKWQEPKHEVKLLAQINSPQKLRAYLDSLLVSDVRRTGSNNGLELNMASADLERFILWDGTLKELPTKFAFDSKLKQTFLDYLDNKWQDPKTGMWGPWYRSADGSVVKTCDLSVTFHLVSYRDSEGVKHWPELIDTTLAMKNGRFPFGWLEEGKTMSNHHNMDLVRLWRLGWPHATPQQKQRISAAIAQMLDFCLHQSLQPDGSFNSPEEDTLSSAFYFGVGFLHEIGYFTADSRFWTDRSFPDAQQVRQRISDRMQAIKLDDSEATWAIWTLRGDAL
ncbi:MAG TPA: hypothetical protein VGI81_25715 [Tepidisphaeraceae bacterium]